MPLIESLDESGTSTCCGSLDSPNVPDVELSQTIQDNTAKWVHMALSRAQANNLEMKTRGQSQIQLWTAERAHRITASSFGRFMLRKAAITDIFVKSVVEPMHFTSASTSYGIKQ